MAKRNRYAGVLQPRLVGSGSASVSVLVLYDIEDDRLRTRVADLCQDYGLDRIQFSAFLGKLSRNLREELQLRLGRLIQDGMARVRVIPICGADMDCAWTLDQYRASEELRGRVVKVRVVGEE